MPMMTLSGYSSASETTWALVMMRVGVMAGAGCLQEVLVGDTLGDGDGGLAATDVYERFGHLSFEQVTGVEDDVGGHEGGDIVAGWLV